MKVTIYRGTREIGGTLIELSTKNTRILLDAGYPLFLNGAPIDANLAKLPPEQLLAKGVLPKSQIGEAYARRFSRYRISRAQVNHWQGKIVMLVRPSMLSDLKSCNLQRGVFCYSLWQGYRVSDYQQRFEIYLSECGIVSCLLHTSGHSTIEDLKRVMT